jgi:uncharacterized caspase-like protein
MARNWAIIIGIDSYSSGDIPSLDGAVQDALAMRDWASAAGGVPIANQILLLAPRRPELVPAGISYDVPTLKNIFGAAQSIVQRSGAIGDRLYFHYSGHGLMVQDKDGDETALIPADLDRQLPLAAGLDSIFEYFKSTQLLDQFFFIDACRDMPFLQNIRLTPMPWAPAPDPTQLPVQQFIMYATSPGLRANELPYRDGDRGAFSHALVEGLQGEGSAKRWDPATGEYVVRYEALFDYVCTQVAAEKRSASPAIAHLIQVPRSAGERGSVRDVNPELFRVPTSAVLPTKLTVKLDPEAVTSVSQVVVQRDGAVVARVDGSSAKPPLEFSLLPREYGVAASAPGHVADPERRPVTLYEDIEVRFRLSAGSGGGPTAAPPPVTPPPTSSTPNGGTRSLTVSSPDQLAVVEIHDEAGGLVQSGLHSVTSSVAPGFYRVRQRVPGAADVAELVEVKGDDRTIDLDAPDPSVATVGANLMKQVGWHPLPDKSFLLSETTSIGKVAAPHVSTFLALSGAVASHDRQKLDAFHLRSVGVKAVDFALSDLPAAVDHQDSAVQVLVGLDFESSRVATKAVRGISVRISTLNSDRSPPRFRRLESIGGVPGLGQLAFPATPGAHWMSLSFPGRPTWTMPVSVVAGRRAMPVFQIDQEGVLTRFIYLPATVPDEYADPARIRQLEQVQRFLAHGRYDYAKEAAQRFELTRWSDPIAGCLAGYLALRYSPTGDWNWLQPLIDQFPDIPDLHLLDAEHRRALRQSSQAKDAYRRCVESGVPLFTEGMVRLEAAMGPELIGAESDELNRRFADRVRSSLLSTFVEAPQLRAEFELDANGAPHSLGRTDHGGFTVILSVDWMPANLQRVIYRLGRTTGPGYRAVGPTFRYQISTRSDSPIRVVMRGRKRTTELSALLSQALRRAYPRPPTAVDNAIREIEGNSILEKQGLEAQ